MKQLLKFSLVSLLCTLSPNSANAGDVENACKSQLKIVDLEYRKGAANFAKIKAANLGNTPLAASLTEFYKTKKFPQSESSMVAVAFNANERHQSPSTLKTMFLKYATTHQRTQDPQGYRNTVIELVKTLVPEKDSRLQWYLSLKDPRLAFTYFRPASGEQMNDVYGAFVNIEKTPLQSGKFTMSIVFSNNESEPLPYLVPLIVHELQHATTYPERIRLVENEKELFALGIVDEAIAFDKQMATYVDLAGKNPEIFCNWLYVTWAYGEILVPLAWTMAAMEREMAGGHYIYNYAKQGTYKDAPFLLTPTGDDLRTDLREKIAALKLKYVK